MKAVLGFLYAVVFLFIASCGNEVEVIPNYQEFLAKPEKKASIDISGVKPDSKLDGFNITDINKKYNYLMNQIGWTDINEFQEVVKLGAAGSAIIEMDLFIDETGRPNKIQFKQNIDKEMQEKIADYYSDLKYVPAEDKGEKVKSKLTILLGTLEYNSDGKQALFWNYQEKGDALNIAKKNFVKDIDEIAYFQNVKLMPEPVGGIEAISGKIAYPEIAKRAGIEGKVYIEAYVNQEGSIDGVKVLKGIGAGCDEAAMEAVLASKFKPGRDDNNDPVKVKIAVPILFKIQN